MTGKYSFLQGRLGTRVSSVAVQRCINDVQYRPTIRSRQCTALVWPCSGRVRRNFARTVWAVAYGTTCCVQKKYRLEPEFARRLTASA